MKKHFSLNTNDFSEEDKVGLSRVMLMMSTLVSEGLVHSPFLYTQLGSQETDGLQRVMKSFINDIQSQLIEDVPSENIVGKYDFGQWCQTFSQA